MLAILSIFISDDTGCQLAIAVASVRVGINRWLPARNQVMRDATVSVDDHGALTSIVVVVRWRV
jgi:hypothetical protein